MPARVAIYLDVNAGALLKASVVQEIQQLVGSGFAAGARQSTSIPNPSSIHSHGRLAKRWMSEARERISLSLAERDSEQILFTSSGTEANQLAIRSVLDDSTRRACGHWITTPVEHDSILKLVPWFRERGGSVDFLPIDSDGRVDAEALAALWKPETALVSIAWANNETGVIAPIERISAEVARLGGVLHVDAAQAWGKLPIDVSKLGARYLTLSGHKIGGLAGTGVLHLGSGARISPLLPGHQEKGRRGGTENVLGAVAAGRAASLLDPIAWAARVAPLRDRLQDAICLRIPGARVNGGGAPRVANTLNLSFEGVEGDSMVMALDLAGYSVSSGSACSSGALEPSHVLMAMGRTKAQAMAAIRVSLPDPAEVDGLEESLEGFVLALEGIVRRMRSARTSATMKQETREHKDLHPAAR